MSVVTVPATRVTKRSWVSFSLSANVDSTDLTKSRYSGNLSVATQEFLGDTDGKPVEILKLNQDGTGRYLEHDALLAETLLGEMVTRADGTSASLLSILEERFTSLAGEITPQS